MKTYDEILKALMFYIGTDSADGVREVLGQEHDPIALISEAMDAYKEYLAEVG